MEIAGLGDRAEAMVLGLDIHLPLEAQSAELDVGDVHQNALTGQRLVDVDQIVDPFALGVEAEVYPAEDTFAGVEADTRSKLGTGFQP